MEVNPKISVIVPVYMASQTLDRCLASISGQRFKDYEVVVIDDGSTDDSWCIISTWARQDNRIKAIRQENHGVAYTRQVGIEHSEGQYTIHVDPDDWIEPDFLESLYKIASSEDADMVICDYQVHTEKTVSDFLYRPNSLATESVLKDLFLGKLEGFVWNKLIRRSLYDQYNVVFPIDFPILEDKWVIASLLRHPIKVCICEKCLYHYVRQNSMSFSRRYSQDIYRQELKIRERFIGLFGRHPYQDTVVDDLSFFVLVHAFYGGRNVFSSRSFHDKFFPYRDLIKRRSSSILEKIPMLLACIGYYQSMIRMVDLYKSVKHIILKFA